MLNLTSDDYNEIVALIIQGEIYFGNTAMLRALESKKVCGIIPRSTFKIISHLDDCEKWIEYSQYPTIFTIDEYNAWCKSTKKENNEKRI